MGAAGRLIYRREVRSSEKMGIGKGASGVGVGVNEAVVDWNAGRSLPLALPLCWLLPPGNGIILFIIVICDVFCL